ncbi:MAG: PAC2 family protein [Acidilobaceae archaeon]|nr:PAC2 family protein [Acidilobaceae archaeon]
MAKVKIVLKEVSRRELADSVLITGFRGFGMVGYTTSKYLALALKAKKVGYVLTDFLPPFIVVEEDGLGFPFDIYYSDSARVTVLVNRALPEREFVDEYALGIARWASRVGFQYVTLVGGLSREFKPAGDEHGYRWASNRLYKGPMLEAPQLEVGLGVMGPLALLYVYLDYMKVPAIMLLPYSFVEGVDYDASLVAIRVISKNLLKLDVSPEELETRASIQRAEVERIIQMIEKEAEREDHESKGMFM